MEMYFGMSPFFILFAGTNLPRFPHEQRALGKFFCLAN